MIAKIAVSTVTYGIDKFYDYAIPLSMEGAIAVGVRVIVPFGQGNRKREGIVVEVLENPDGTQKKIKLKQIVYVLDDAPVYSEKMLKLASFIRQRYFCTFFDGAKVMLPSGMWSNSECTYRLKDEVSKEQAYETVGNSGILKKIIDLLAETNQPMTEHELTKIVNCSDMSGKISKLCKLELLDVQFRVRRNIYDKFEKTVKLIVPLEQVCEKLSDNQKKNGIYYQLAKLLTENGDMSQNELCYQSGAGISAVASLEKRGIVECYKKEIFRRPTMPLFIKSNQSFLLSDQQNTVLNGLVKLFDDEKAKAALLFGVTGSGKTEVYIELIRYALQKGKGALVLVPEISLTPQMSSRFTSIFGDCVAILHSGLTAAERLDEWKRVKKGEACIVIGTRSAVFAPVWNLGAVIIDEEHDSSFVSEEDPKYNAVEIAKYRCTEENALLVLGSATPSVESYYNAQQGKYSYFYLNQRFGNTQMPNVVIADMRGVIGDHDCETLGKTLLDEIAKNLQNHEQSIILLNRRGTDRLVRCVSCGYTPQCENCTNALTYHEKQDSLICHYCGYSIKNISICPECGGHHLSYVKAGTQKLEKQLGKLFPRAKISRMDADSVCSKKSRENILSDMYDGTADILVGTQMVTKGLDFDNVTLVGVVDADMSLYSGDFRAAERTFSLITQVVGRAGRREKQGRAIIQTMSPENSVIKNAARQDYKSFYEEEIQTRMALELPPIRDIVVFTITSPFEQRALEGGMFLVRRIDALMQNYYPNLKSTVLGPIPARLAKLNNKYRYMVTFRTTANSELRKFAAAIMKEFCADPKNKKTYIAVDINRSEI